MSEFEDGQQTIGHVEVSPVALRSGFEAVGAIAAVLIILAVGAGAGTLAARAFEIWVGADQPGARPAGAVEAMNAAQLALFLVGFQITSIVLTLAAAPYFARSTEALIPLGWPRRALWVIAASTFVLFAIMLVFGTVVYVFDREAFVSDVKPFADMAQTRVWWALFIGAAVGAPLAEELLFRGLLFGVLRQTRLRLAGTIILTAALWAALHMQYSLYGLVAIFCIGLYLGWLRERTASLIPPIVCHALYNGAIVVTLAKFTGPGFAG